MHLLTISSILLWIVVVVNLFLILTLIRRINAKTQRTVGLAPGTPAPDFTAHSLLGERITLSNYLGHKVLFIYISVNCKPCRELMPSLKTVLPKITQSGVEVVLVSLSDTPSTQAYIEEFNLILPVLTAAQEHEYLMQKYKIGGTPYYYFIDENGNVVSGGFPGSDGKEWGKLIDGLRTKDVVTSDPVLQE